MSEHAPVLLHEVIEGLNLKPTSVVVDLTLGRAGHSALILEKITKGHLYGFDQDITALEESKSNLDKVGRNYTLIHSNFENFDTYLNNLGVKKVDAILVDLGVSSPQFDVKERGFSYRYDAPLDMRMDQTNNQLTAAIVVNTYSEQKLKEIFWAYAEHRFSPQIARKIVEYRKIKPIESTFELVDIIKSALPGKELRKPGHPAKTIFQALRIEVNAELNVLETLLNKAPNYLNEEGCLAVITFHSLEDRAVKQKFKALTTLQEEYHPLHRITDGESPDYELYTRKPILAGEIELAQNKRAASAKLRILIKRRK